MNKRKMEKHNMEIHCNAMYRWNNIETTRTYKNFTTKNRWLKQDDFHEAKNRKELAEMRKKDVKARKQQKAKNNLVRKLNKRNMGYMALEWLNWLEDRKCSNNWKKTR